MAIRRGHTATGIGLATALTLAFGVYRMAAADSGCPNQTCLAGYACGGQGESVPPKPPGHMSLCTPDQYGQACNWCDGTTVVRRCISSTQTRKCTAPDTATTCGNPKKGKCTYYTQIGIGRVYYCKDTGAGAGTHSCKSIDECDGDTAC